MDLRQQTFDRKWFKNFDDFRKYIDINGCLPDNKSSLCNWYHNNIIKYRKGTLEKNRYQAIVSVFPDYFSTTYTEFNFKVKVDFISSKLGNTGPEAFIGNVVKERKYLSLLLENKCYTVENFVKGLLQTDEYGRSLPDGVILKVYEKAHLNIYSILKEYFNLFNDSCEEWLFNLFIVLNYSYRFDFYNDWIFKFNDGFKSCMCKDLKRVVDSVLTNREYKTLYLRFVKKYSFEQTAKIYDVTRERIKQIETKSLRKLKYWHNFYENYTIHNGKWVSLGDLLYPTKLVDWKRENGVSENYDRSKLDLDSVETPRFGTGSFNQTKLFETNDVEQIFDFVEDEERF